jgi:hypothetical protein
MTVQSCCCVASHPLIYLIVLFYLSLSLPSLKILLRIPFLPFTHSLSPTHTTLPSREHTLPPLPPSTHAHQVPIRSRLLTARSRNWRSYQHTRGQAVPDYWVISFSLQLLCLCILSSALFTTEYIVLVAVGES